MISPQEIGAKAARLYPRFLAAWARGEDGDFFPRRVPAKLKLIKGDLVTTKAAIVRLREASKPQRGWGYRVQWQQRRTRDFGSNEVPVALWIETRDDLLRLAGRSDDFARAERVAARIRQQLPQLDPWVQGNPNQLASLDDKIDRLVAVAQYFMENPWPQCFLRELPLPGIDTKFIERNKGLLRQWLDQLLPDSAIQPGETDFNRRYGLLDGQHRTIRVLDPELKRELNLPFDELSLRLSDLATLSVSNVKVVIVENQTTLLTLPPLRRGIALGGIGSSVPLLRNLAWLADCPLYYWGDVDVAGFCILSALRSVLPQTQSRLMDAATLDRFARWVGAGKGAAMAPSQNLTTGEAEAYERCLRDNLQLEQEKIPRSAVEEMFANL